MKAIALASLGLLCTLSASAAPLRIEAGLWSFEIVSRNPFVPAPVIQRFKDCVEVTELDPDRFLREFGSCRWSPLDERADTMAWTFSCDTRTGKASGVGRMTSTGTTIAGDLDVDLTTDGMEQPLTLNNSWSGERLGACP
ncbi:MAG: DUF3617 family protein [Pseudomonadales bacterium]|jgi:hypothetical protein|nr:DUF3617 family protein [Pseudomonadales bacterium]